MKSFGRSTEAVLFLVGTIVGVGMFGIPYVFSQSGFVIGVTELLAIALAAVVVHLAYLDVVSRTSETHRLPGYVTLYLGSSVGWISRFSYLFGLSGTLLAYLIVGGHFLSELAQWFFPATYPGIGVGLFYLIGVLIVSQSIRFEGAANALLTMGLIGAIIVIALTAIPYLTPSHLTAINMSAFFQPYGVLLFAMAGAAVIPDMRRLLTQKEAGRSRRLVVIGTLIPTLLYLLFALAVVGVTGEATTPDAISGLAARLGAAYLVGGAIIGFLAAITSFITLGVVLEGMFVSDFSLRTPTARVLTPLIPLVLYLIGFQDFIAIISVVGALAIGLDSVLILLTYRRAAALVTPAADFSFRLPLPALVVVIGMFALGAAYEVTRYF